MKNINEYKKRFYNLMESTLGDVKPLISEQSSEVIKIKAWVLKSSRDRDVTPDYNFDTTNHQLDNNGVEFNFTSPKTIEKRLIHKGKGGIMCGSQDGSIVVTMDGKIYTLYVTSVAAKKLTKLCDEYASVEDDDMEDDDMMDNNYA